MPRFKFHLCETGVVTIDEEGYPAADIDAARLYAIRCARDIMSADLRDGTLCLACHIEVVDPRGKLVDIVEFRDAVTVSAF